MLPDAIPETGRRPGLQLFYYYLEGFIFLFCFMYVDILHVCMSVHAYIYLVLMEIRKGHWIPWNWGSRQLSLQVGAGNQVLLTVEPSPQLPWLPV